MVRLLVVFEMFTSLGMRKSCDLLIYIDIGTAITGTDNVKFKPDFPDGIHFYLSDNGVILTSGKNGVLEPKYFKKVVSVADGKPVI